MQVPLPCVSLNRPIGKGNTSQTKRYLWEFIFLIRVLGAGGPSEKCRGSETVGGKKAGGRGGRDRAEEGGHSQYKPLSRSGPATWQGSRKQVSANAL